MAAMTKQTHDTPGIDTVLRALFWGAVALLLLAPAVAMRFTAEVNWTAGDFVFATVLLGAAGTAFEVTMRMSRSWTYRFASGFAVAAAFLIVFVNAAVGMIGDGPNIHNLLFLAVVGMALVGSIAARFRAAGMGLVMAAAGIVHIAIALAGLPVDRIGGIYSALFGCIWLLSAFLFRKAAADAGR
jgi:hypothetical protein